MRAIVINPYNETVSEVDIPVSTGNLKPIYELLPHARSVDFCYFIPKHFVMVDDEGLMNDSVNHLFIHRDYGQPLAGIGVILGKVGPEGDLGPATISLEDVQRKVAFPGDKVRYSHMETSEGSEEDPIFGKVFVIRNEAKFVYGNKGNKKEKGKQGD